MNLQQLRIIGETLRQNFNLTEVANALHTSQPGVSRHIKDLEGELGIEIFIRRGKRLLGLTEPGKELAAVVDRILLDVHNLRRIADQFANRETGNFVVATTHTQARYALPQIIKWFKTDYPKVHLALHQGSPQEIAEQLVGGEADIGIATEQLDRVPELVTFPFYSWQHALIVPPGHPLCRSAALTLRQISDYPIITYHHGFTGRTHIDRAFAEDGLVPDIVLSAIDADVIKTYVELGLGVGIVASMAYSAEKDHGLMMIPVPHLFPESTTHLAVRRGTYLRSYVLAFIEKICPEIGEEKLRTAIQQPNSPEPV
ncbi:MAG TPA: CysB family HTH-type transcriptional regulator [Accumulibacter sp.]|nr:CysB family HTH-type transcriptional regulator [Accumulibacter sp.]HMW18169.1 CysB family HTH-type transcriptional regulator [Accumulibacter sp.]HMX23496.1 CysB family HTH-type transcriptional regulator [Accumulibacter sp.]HMY06899.1 CysB family HTH-type transcriptional regulator [Accumulibacter sp.]HNC18640.1 CysB family HTH-type transcriptional regulator [Accumulibacter sp.]